MSVNIASHAPTVRTFAFAKGDAVYVHIDSWAGRVMLPAVIEKVCPKRSRVKYVNKAAWPTVGKSVPNTALSPRQGKSAAVLLGDTDMPGVSPVGRKS